MLAAGTGAQCTGETSSSVCFHLFKEQFRGKPAIAAEAVSYVNAGGVNLGTFIWRSTQPGRGGLAVGRDGTDPVCQEQLRSAVSCANAACVPAVLVGRAEHTALLRCLCCQRVPVSRRGCGKDPLKRPHVGQPRSKGSASWGAAQLPPPSGVRCYWEQ